MLSNNLFKIDNNDQKDEFHYFRNIRTFLQSHDFSVHHTNVDWDGTLVRRARELKDQVAAILQSTASDRVHIIGHSMGGLDARQMLWANREEAFHEKIASLTTIGAPHHGTPFADFLSKGLAEDALALGLAFEGLLDLRTEAMEAFNTEVSGWERQNGVRYRAYAGQQDLIHIFSPLKFSWLLIRSAAGANDGFVPVSSARWNDEYFVPPVLDADHLNQIGWWDDSEAWRGVEPAELEDRIKQLYLDIAHALAQDFPLD